MTWLEGWLLVASAAYQEQRKANKNLHIFTFHTQLSFENKQREKRSDQRDNCISPDKARA